MTPPEAESVRTQIRRRPTRRHHRNRLLRRVSLALVLAFFAAGFSALALRHFSPSLFTSSKGPDWQATEASRTRLLLANQEQAFRPADARPVYPYSVVAGGIEDARELKWVAEHDPVVASHYAGFDYDHARVVRLVLARTVYVSYRIGNKVYWMRHRVSLHKGEKLITDGKMTARARCGNRVEEVPQQATSSSEPAAAKFDEPVQPSPGTAVQSPPVAFQSALLNRPGMPGVDPTAPLSLYSPFVGGSWVPLSSPPIPSGVCAPVKKKKNGQVEVFSADAGKKKKKLDPCGSGGGEAVPEPATWLLVGSGLAAMYWQARRKFVRT